MKKVKIIDAVILALGLTCIIIAAIYFCYIYFKDLNTIEVWDDVRSLALTEELISGADNISQASQAPVKRDLGPEVNPYINLFDINKDMCAWLTIPGSPIDYPVMHTPKQEDYYLYRNFYDEPDRNGCLVLSAPDSMDPPSTHLLIHGHNMKNGLMFGTLSDYKSKEFRDEHPDLILYTKDEIRHYRVVGAMNTRILDEGEPGFAYYEFFEAKTQKEVDAFTNQANIYNIYDDTKITCDISKGEHLLTLSTCRGPAGGLDRFIVMFKRVAA